MVSQLKVQPYQQCPMKLNQTGLFKSRELWRSNHSVAYVLTLNLLNMIHPLSLILSGLRPVAELKATEFQKIGERNWHCFQSTDLIPAKTEQTLAVIRKEPGQGEDGDGWLPRAWTTRVTAYSTEAKQTSLPHQREESHFIRGWTWLPVWLACCYCCYVETIKQPR